MSTGSECSLAEQTQKAWRFDFFTEFLDSVLNSVEPVEQARAADVPHSRNAHYRSNQNSIDIDIHQTLNTVCCCSSFCSVNLQQ
jgi:hypothetical protein